jgi:hypothetical protein
MLGDLRNDRGRMARYELTKRTILAVIVASTVILTSNAGYARALPYKQVGGSIIFSGKSYPIVPVKKLFEKSFPIANGIPFISGYGDIGQNGYSFASIVSLMPVADSTCYYMPSLETNWHGDPSEQAKKTHFAVVDWNNLSVLRVETSPCARLRSSAKVYKIYDCTLGESFGCSAVIAGRVQKIRRAGFLQGGYMNYISLDYVVVVGSRGAFGTILRFAEQNQDYMRFAFSVK